MLILISTLLDTVDVSGSPENVSSSVISEKKPRVKLSSLADSCKWDYISSNIMMMHISHLTTREANGHPHIHSFCLTTKLESHVTSFSYWELYLVNPRVHLLLLAWINAKPCLYSQFLRVISPWPSFLFFSFERLVGAQSTIFIISCILIAFSGFCYAKSNVRDGWGRN